MFPLLKNRFQPPNKFRDNIYFIKLYLDENLAIIVGL